MLWNSSTLNETEKLSTRNLWSVLENPMVSYKVEYWTATLLLIVNSFDLELFCMFTLNWFNFVSRLVNLSSDTDDKLKIYRDNFEKAYIEATETFYRQKGPEYMASNGVQNYMK